eukprot:COSAG02_NODE_9915_length_2076_cov_1.880627_1_plen_41_part_10
MGDLLLAAMWGLVLRVGSDRSGEYEQYRRHVCLYLLMDFFF